MLRYGVLRIFDDINDLIPVRPRLPRTSTATYRLHGPRLDLGPRTKSILQPPKRVQPPLCVEMPPVTNKQKILLLPSSLTSQPVSRV
jgi:hypothetical protein